MWSRLFAQSLFSPECCLLVCYVAQQQRKPMDVSTGAASKKGVCLYSKGKHKREKVS